MLSLLPVPWHLWRTRGLGPTTSECGGWRKKKLPEPRALAEKTICGKLLRGRRRARTVCGALRGGHDTIRCVYEYMDTVFQCYVERTL